MLHSKLCTTHLQCILMSLCLCLLPLQGCVLTVNTEESGPQSMASEYSPKKNRATVIYLVRHAEKEATRTDPGLTAQGEQRAAALVRFLANEPIDALLSSDYQRTRMTLAPLARQRQLDVQTYDVGNPDALVARVLRRYAGRTVVIAGHSNTVPDLVERFMVATGQGAEAAVDLDHDDYERIFVVVRPPRAPATVLNLAFSGVTP